VVGGVIWVYVVMPQGDFSGGIVLYLECQIQTIPVTSCVGGLCNYVSICFPWMGLSLTESQRW